MKLIKRDSYFERLRGLRGMPDIKMPKPLATQLEERHVLFLDDTGPVYLPKLFRHLTDG